VVDVDVFLAFGFRVFRFDVVSDAADYQHDRSDERSCQPTHDHLPNLDLKPNGQYTATLLLR